MCGVTTELCDFAMDLEREQIMISPLSSSASHQMTSFQASTDDSQCFGCTLPIGDRFLLRVAGRSWHESCVSCSLCGAQLTDSCFVKGGRLLCRSDYIRFFNVACHGCGMILAEGDLIMRAASSVFHSSCFCCSVCGLQMTRGDQYYVRDGRLICQIDFEKEFLLYPPMHQGELWSFGSKSECDSSGDEGGDGEGGKGPKRPRTILTTSQRRKFKSAFELNPKPCRKVRESLAAETGLTVRVVQVWFQNQRAKVKKMARKQTDPKDENEKKKSNKAKKKIEPGQDENKNRITSEDFVEETRLETKTDMLSFASHTGQYPLPTQNLSDFEASDDLTGIHGQTAPIDKLYCMQNNYFTPPS